MVTRSNWATLASGPLRRDRVLHTASESIASSVKDRALNEVKEWGPSDHGRLMIEFTKQNGFDSVLTELIPSRR